MTRSRSGRPGRDVVGPRLVHQVLGDTAANCPGKIALEYGGGRLSYGELDQMSSQLAATLRREGVAVGDRVALQLEKTAEAIIAILGILKAGAVYVPLDCRMPAPRAATILADCGVRVMIGGLARSLAIRDQMPGSGPALQLVITVEPELPDKTTVRMLTWREALTTSPAARVAQQTERNLAYILYTSGSTGTPKGVMITHLAAMSFINWAQKQFQLTGQDRVLSQAPFHFDLSIFDLFVTFRAGATLVLPPPNIAFAPADYGRYLDRAAISVFYATPAILTTLISHGKLGDHRWQHLRLVLFAGDVMSPRHLRQLMHTISRPRWFNLYGPTETNVCTCYEVTSPPTADQPRIPIGRACDNFELLVVDEQGAPVEEGREGELWVRGPGTMSGYWGRPDLNAGCFVSGSPPSGLARYPFYRTGDRVRREADGNLVFLGRLDNMIKTRGYRVEPGEIECLLLKHPLVTEVAVVPVQDDIAGTLLKAVVACGTGAQPSARELQRLCAQNLPDYMIPRYIEFAGSLPKTSTGKLDRLRLHGNVNDFEDLP